MCIFFDQHGNIRFRYRTYGIDEVVPYQVLPRIRPNDRINVVVPGKRGPEQHLSRWGFGTGQFDWNARDDRLKTSPLWSSMWLRPGHHLLIPVTHAYEATKRHGGRQWFAVERRDEEVWFVPALGRTQPGPAGDEWHATMVTVDAGPVFEPIHDTPREIVCLRSWDEATLWLAAKDEGELRRLLRPAGEDLLRSYRVHDDVFKPSFPSERCAQPYVPAQRGLGAFG